MNSGWSNLYCKIFGKFSDHNAKNFAWKIFPLPGNRKKIYFTHFKIKLRSDLTNHEERRIFDLTLDGFSFTLLTNCEVWFLNNANPNATGAFSEKRSTKNKSISVLAAFVFQMYEFSLKAREDFLTNLSVNKIAKHNGTKCRFTKYL